VEWAPGKYKWQNGLWGLVSMQGGLHVIYFEYNSKHGHMALHPTCQFMLTM